MKTYVVSLSIIVSSTVTDSTMIPPLLQGKKDKEEKAEGICAGTHSHFDIDNEVTLEMHWDIGDDNFSVSLG